MIALVAVAISPFFVEVTPEIRSTYQSLGKIVEDRPMQITNIRFGYNMDSFGRFGIRNWDVSSLTDRRSDEHRHALYHTEHGLIWQYDVDISEGWRLKSDLTRSWTIFRGFENNAANITYHWWQLEQSLENLYLVPFYRARKCFRGNDYFYFRAGVRRRLALVNDFYVMPSVFADGGSSRCHKRAFGSKVDGGRWGDGVFAVSARLDLGCRLSENFSVFLFVEQYEVVERDGRRTNSKGGGECAHSDWTIFGVGVKVEF